MLIMGLTGLLVFTGTMPPFLSMQHVSVARGEQRVLHDLSLEIAQGEHLAILGPNGCGKSTLIRTLTREIYPLVPRDGEPAMRFRLLGRERWDLSQLRSSFGVVGAELPGERTPAASGLNAVLAGFFGASALWPQHTITPTMTERAREALGIMGSLHLEAKPVGAMSAGEQRRVMIARALVHRPGMLLLDEPSNALDLRAQHELRTALRRVAREGTGLILVTHQLADILPEIRRVVLMRDGRITADGNRESLLTEPVMRKLFGVPVTLTERDGFVHAW